MVGVVSRLLPVVGASLFVLPLFPAQTPNSTDLKYQSPPEVMVKLVDAPLTPAISLSPAHGKGPRRILIEQSSPLPTIVESWYGTDHPETAANLTALAQPLTFDKQEAEAQSLLERALTIQKHVNGPVNSTVATTQNQLGILAFQRKQFDVARNYFTEAMNTWKQLFGEQYPSVAVAYSNLGSVCLEEKNFACSEKMYREAVNRFDAYSPNSLNDAVAHTKLGRAFLREGRFADAENETLIGYRYLVKQMTPADHFLTAARKDLAAIYDGLHDGDKAAQVRAELNLSMVQGPMAKK